MPKRNPKNPASSEEPPINWENVASEVGVMLELNQAANERWLTRLTPPTPPDAPAGTT